MDCCPNRNLRSAALTKRERLRLNPREIKFQMTKRAALIFWTCVIAIQVTGATMDFMGGSLDDPIRLLGILFLTPGLALIWGWMGRHLTNQTTPSEYAAMLGIAVAINLGIAALIHLVFFVIRKFRDKTISN
jgi:hypothetical protein